jgi:uncharacterized membrane protein
MNYPWHLYIMAILYMAAGINHFIKPKMYLRIMPNYLPNHKSLVALSGLAEIILGIMVCIPLLKNITIILIILMLFVFLTVHFYMLTNKKASAGLPKWVLILRIPMQFALMYWAYSYFSL